MGHQLHYLRAVRHPSDCGDLIAATLV